MKKTGICTDFLLHGLYKILELCTKILGLKSQDFVQNSTNYMGGESREIAKIFGAKLSRYREIITTGRGRSFDQTSFDEGCKLRLVFLAC